MRLMQYRLAAPLALAAAAALALPVRAAGAPVTFLPQDVGARVHLHIVRTTQQIDAPAVTTSDVDLLRRDAATYILERKDAQGKPNPALVAFAADGTLQLKDARAASGPDADVAVLLPALGSAQRAVDGARDAGAWTAQLALRGASPNAPLTVAVPLKATPASDDGFDLAGSARMTVAPQAASDGGENGEGGSARRRRGGFGGGFPGAGGGFPGAGSGGFPTGGGERPGRAGPQVTVVVRIDGHVSHGGLRRITIGETRAITLDGTPFVNASTTSIDISS